MADIPEQLNTGLSDEEIMKAFNTALGTEELIAEETERAEKEEALLRSDVALNRQTLGFTKKNLLPVNSASSPGFIIPEGTPLTADPGRYILSGHAGTGGELTLQLKNADGDSVAYSSSTYADDTDFSAELTVAEQSSTVSLYVSGGTWTGLMLRSADIIDDTFEPYTDDVCTLIQKLSARITALEGDT